MSSIRRQLTLGVMGAVVVLYGLAAVFCYVVTTRTVRGDFDTAYTFASADIRQQFDRPECPVRVVGVRVQVDGGHGSVYRPARSPYFIWKPFASATTTGFHGSEIDSAISSTFGLT